VAGAEAGSSPEAEVGNLHLLVLHHTGAVPLLLGIQAVVLAEEAGALQDPWLSSGSRLLQPPSPCQCCGSTRPTAQSSLVPHHHLAEELLQQDLVLQVGQSRVELG
jgi:hypothetical protein